MWTSVAIVGCGFVADYYVSSLRVHPGLRLAGAFDLNPERNARFAAYHGVRAYASYDELLGDPSVDIVVNLTPPESHYAVSRRALEAGKHVYSEKPVTMRLEDAADLVETARRVGRQFSAAPCCPLGESAQTLWRAIRNGAVGRVRLAYAEVDDGVLHRTPHELWRSSSGAPWPGRDEARVGCVRAHAAYAVTRLAAMFGPVRAVSAFAARVVDDMPEVGGNGDATRHGVADARGPDFGVACLRFDGGVVARLTCSTLAPRDRSLRVFGDEGVIRTRDCSDDRSPVLLRRYWRVRRRLILSPLPRRCRLLDSGTGRVRYRGSQRRDFARGIAELAAAVREGREPTLSPAFCLHTTEVILAIHAAAGGGIAPPLRTTFEPIPPMAWARD